MTVVYGGPALWVVVDDLGRETTYAPDSPFVLGASVAQAGGERSEIPYAPSSPEGVDWMRGHLCAWQLANHATIKANTVEAKREMEAAFRAAGYGDDPTSEVWHAMPEPAPRKPTAEEILAAEDVARFSWSGLKVIDWSITWGTPIFTAAGSRARPERRDRPAKVVRSRVPESVQAGLDRAAMSRERRRSFLDRHDGRRLRR